MFCSNCGTKVIDSARFCSKCGAKLIQDNRENQEPMPAPRQESEKKPIPSAEPTFESEQKSVKEEESLLKGEPIKVSSSELVERTTNPTEPVVASEDNQSDFYSNATFRWNEKSYGSTIKPYYCVQFNRIASGEKAKFNWAAFLWGGYNMLYNGCNKLFCMTFLPLSVVGIMVQLLNALGEVSSDYSLVNISLIMSGIVWLCSFILSISTLQLFSF